MAEPTEKVAEFIRLAAPQERWPRVCSRTLQCYESGLTVALHVATPQDAEHLDGLLWTFQDNSFLPHVRLGEAQEPVLEPVIIYCGDERIGEADVLFEASGGAPREDLGRFAHILDFAELYDDALAGASRRRYKACRDAGCRMRYVT